MKITQFYPLETKKKLTTLSLTFERSGIFVEHNGNLYFNSSEIELIFYKDYLLANTFETIKFESTNGEFILLTKKILDNSNIRNEAIRISNQISSESKGFSDALIEEIEEFCLSTLIDNSLERRDEELFYKLTSKGSV